ncbi:MAG: HAMP domain-containing protein [Desulfobacter sp.]|nr:MAG: HAMP domain-containing protein [Desulfobacter sp.]
MKFSIRQKISFLFLIFMAVNSIIWFFNHYSNSAINSKLILIEKKRDLLDTVLEARRYEKNFFLRRDLQDLTQALAYIQKTAEKQALIEKEFPGIPSVRHRSRTIAAYQRNMKELHDLYHEDTSTQAHFNQVLKIQETATRLGRELTTDIEKFEKNERERVFELLDRSRGYLLASLFSLFILTISTAIFLVWKLNRPLKSIETGIKRIVNGEFDKIPEIKTGDEFESLAHSLNHMIQELDKRKKQLVQAEKMSSLGTLTSGVAHELNNPLNNISTSVQIIKEEIEEPDIEFKKTLLTQVEQEINRSRDIIRALLEFSRQSHFSIERVRFKNLIQSTMHLIAGEIPADIDVVIAVEEDLEGKMDPRRIQQVLLNLIINGFLAMDTGEGGRLTIGAFNDNDANNFVFKVSDTGRGIKKENLAKIFDPFFTTREVGKGSGLGLSIIHGIIEQHGGTIDVESSPGKGTTFTVSLPG